ncbi:TonB-dependent receptor [Asticcacaulis sp. AND118]|uniref:TonB-dependent receptor n=1 Tax=Asticcacaulis sp. AND118 TaxID=2840468 RepID=UPI001D00002A|nr:TonB-dependent receptor [Asticcacaulis sp. AND118]UDF05229.1 TonB-dependent receptor [Asticcacaulis sp. AND118]
MKISTKLMLMASAMGLGFSVAAPAVQAQDANANEAAAKDGGHVTEVVIYANRATAAAAQMKSDNTISVMSADDLEHTAVHNVAEALALLPGVTVTNTGNSFFGGVDGASRGEGMFVGVRGMNTEFTLALINGVNVAQGMPYSRQVQLSLLPPSGLKTIVVNKNSTAEMDGDAIGGTVDFRTPSAFSFRDGYASMAVSGRVESRARDYGEDGMGGGVNAEFAKRFGGNQQFGFYGSAFYDKRNYANSMIAGIMTAQQDGSWGYLHAVKNASGAYQNPTGYDKDANLAQTGLNVGVSTGFTERFGGNFSADWRYSDTLDFFVRGSYAFAETHQNSTLAQFVNDKVYVENTATPGLFDLTGVTNSSVRAWYETNPEEADLGTLSFGAVKRTGNWTLSPTIFYSEGDNDRPDHIEASMRNNQSDNYNTGALAGKTVPFGGMFIAYNDEGYPIPLLNATQQNQINNASTTLLARRAGQLTQQFSGQEKMGLKFDAQYDFDGGNLAYIKTGFKYVASHRRVISRDWTNDHLANLMKTAGVKWADIGLATDYFDLIYPGLYNIRAPKVNHNRLFEIFYTYFPAATAAADQEYMNGNTLKGDENVSAAYVTGKYDFGALEVIPGLRFEHTDIENTYWNSAKKVFESNSTDYNEWLPSLFVNYRPEAGGVYRASLTRAYMRPAMVQLGNKETIREGDDNSLTITQGNPDLKTLKSWNLDFSGEWSNAEGGYAMVGAYYKKLSDYMYDNGSTQVNTGETPTNLLTYNGKTYNRVSLSHPTNGGEGTVKGLEVQLYQKFGMLPGWMSGFGAGANFTRQWTEVDIGKGEKHRIQNAPDFLANLKLNYAWKKLTVDLNYNYTGESVIAYNNVAGLELWTRPIKRTDLHAGYDFGKGVKLDLSVSNLFEDYSYWAHVGKNSLAINDIVDSGSTTLLTLKYSY